MGESRLDEDDSIRVLCSRSQPGSRRPASCRWLSPFTHCARRVHSLKLWIPMAFRRQRDERGRKLLRSRRRPSSIFGGSIAPYPITSPSRGGLVAEK
jgi:hypothetical protein